MNAFLKKYRKTLLRAAAGIGLAAAFAIASPTWAAPVHGFAPSVQSSAGKPSPGKQAVGVLDINTATEDQLKALPGMGNVYAKRVVASRPYTSKNQLVRRGILPQGVYDKIKSKITARRPKHSSSK